MSGEDPVLLDQVEPRIYRITLNRPAKRNALNREARRTLLGALEECTGRASVIILTGAGGTFTSGMDLKRRSGRSHAHRGVAGGPGVRRVRERRDLRPRPLLHGGAS